MTTTRETRAEETRERRKQRGGGELEGGRLAVPASLLDKNRFKYRWINDNDARMFVKTKEDDWEVVARDGKLCESDDLGTAYSKVVGTKPDGKPLLSYLCRKRKAWYDEDQAEKSAELDRQMTELRRGNARDGSSQSDYVPASGIVMRG